MRRWKREHETRLQHKHEAEERCSHCGEVLTAEKRGTIPQSVAVAGAPSPTFPVSAALVTTQIKAVTDFINKFLVKPQE